MLPLQEENTH